MSLEVCFRHIVCHHCKGRSQHVTRPNCTGSLALATLGFTYAPAIFQVDANKGTAISIMNGPDVLLTGSNGGTISLHIGSASTGASFVTSVTPPTKTQVMIGGTLTVGTPLANPSGNYTGTFSVTFIQQ